MGGARLAFVESTRHALTVAFVARMLLLAVILALRVTGSGPTSARRRRNNVTA
jgi:hypothetical protein